jgi:hypothetical protein
LRVLDRRQLACRAQEVDDSHIRDICVWQGLRETRKYVLSMTVADDRELDRAIAMRPNTSAGRTIKVAVACCAREKCSL